MAKNHKFRIELWFVIVFRKFDWHRWTFSVFNKVHVCVRMCARAYASSVTVAVFRLLLFCWKYLWKTASVPIVHQVLLRKYVTFLTLSFNRFDVISIMASCHWPNEIHLNFLSIHSYENDAINPLIYTIKFSFSWPLIYFKAVNKLLYCLFAV